MKHLALMISILLHPLLLPLYGLFFIFNTGSVFSMIPAGSRFYCYVITLVALVLMPLLSLPLLKKLKLIDNYRLDSNQERLYPALIAIFFAFLGFYIIGRVPYTNIIQQLYLILIIVLAGFSIVTIRWKMSMHMTAIGTICGFLVILGMKYLGNVREVLMMMLFLSGLLASSRLYLEKHNPAQIYAGFLFGFLFVVGILF